MSDKKNDLFMFAAHPYPVEIYICLTEKIYREAALLAGVKEKHLYSFKGALGSAVYHTIKNTVPLLFLVLNVPKKSDPLDVIGIITHEAAHIVQIVNDYINSGKINHEPDAYLVQAITESTIELYNEKVRKILA